MPSEQKRDSIQECRPLPLLQALCSLPRPIMGFPLPLLPSLWPRKNASLYLLNTPSL